MAVTKQELMDMNVDEIFDWDSNKQDKGLEAMGIMIGKFWSKSRKAFELNKAIKQNNLQKTSDVQIQS